LHLADVKEMTHNFADAERLYRQVLKAQPGNLVAANNLAWVLAHRGPSPEALELVQRAIAIAGPLADLLDTRAKVYLSLGRAAEAVQDLEDAVNEAPTAMRYFQLALAPERHANPTAPKSPFALARRLRALRPGPAATASTPATCTRRTRRCSRGCRKVRWLGGWVVRWLGG